MKHAVGAAGVLHGGIAWGEVIRVKPEHIVPPFDAWLVDRAIRHFMRHGTPWIPYARRPEDYGTTWLAVPNPGGYQFQLCTEGEDPWDPLIDWIGELCQTVEDILLGKRRFSPEFDSSEVEELLTEALDSLLQAPPVTIS